MQNPLPERAERPKPPEEWTFRVPGMGFRPPKKHLGAVTGATISAFHDPEMVSALGDVLKAGGIAHLTGPRGTGKTQLAAWVWSIWGSGQRVYTTAADMLAAMKSWYGIDARDAAHNNRTLETVPLLIIDELHERRGTPEDEHLLIRLIDKRYGNMRATLLVSNLDPAAVESNVGRSVASRLSEFGGPFVTTGWPEYRRKIAAGRGGPGAKA